MTTRLDLTRDQVLAFRRRAGALDERLPPGPESLRRAAWCGLQDTVLGDAWILAEDEAAVRAAAGPVAPARLRPRRRHCRCQVRPRHRLLGPVTGRAASRR